MPSKLELEIINKVIDEVRLKRRILGISHDKIAKATGLNRSAISLIESRQRIPSLLNAYIICKALDISLADIISKVERIIQE